MFRIQVIRRLFRDINERGIIHGALDIDEDRRDRVARVKVFLLIKIVKFLIGNVRFSSFPNRRHRVKGLDLLDLLVFVGRFAIVVKLRDRLFHFHPDRVADVIGIFLDEAPDIILFQKLVVIFFLRVLP